MRQRMLDGLLAVVLGTAALLAPPAHAAPAGPSPARGCDPLAPAECLLPFPNDWYTRPDPRTDTGRRVAFDTSALPRPATGQTVDPAAWNRSDGFSPGSTLIAQVPGLDLARTGAAPLTDIGRSLDRDAPIVLLDTTTGERWPYWAEPDSNATDPARRALLIHPARNFEDGHHYAVALRHLKDGSGRTIPAAAPFAAVAGKRLPAHDPLRTRQDRLRPGLSALRRAGVSPRDSTSPGTSRSPRRAASPATCSPSATTRSAGSATARPPSRSPGSPTSPRSRTPGSPARSPARSPSRAIWTPPAGRPARC